MAVEEETTGLMAHMRFSKHSGDCNAEEGNHRPPLFHCAYIRRTDEKDGI